MGTASYPFREATDVAQDDEARCAKRAASQSVSVDIVCLSRYECDCVFVSPQHSRNNRTARHKALDTTSERGSGKEREREAARNAEDVIARAAAADMSRGQTESRAAKHRLLLLLVEKKADGLTDCGC